MIKESGAGIIVGMLERQGVRTVAGIPGGSNLPLYDALGQSHLIHHVLARHEQGAGFIAQGMARISGRPEVCLATSGPGAVNILTAVADARLDSVPLVCITGQVPSGMIGTDAFQEVDTYGMSVPITKHNFLVRSAEELPQTLSEAFRIAASGRPGPVLVDVPKDVQMATVKIDAWPETARPDPLPVPDIRDIRRAAELINAARRPLLYLGGGAANAGIAAARLAEKISAPAAVTLMALGVIPCDHPLYLGMLGMHAARSTNLLLEECDLLIAVGARFDDRATGKVQDFCPRAAVIHVDIDSSEIGKIRCAEAGIQGDADLFLQALLPLVRRDERPDWRARLAVIRGEHSLPDTAPQDMRQPRCLIAAAAALLDETAIVTTDVGQHQMWTAQTYPFRRPRRWLTSGGLGTMGFGLPAAIGAALAEPGATIACFSGDGSLMMNVQELATAAEERVNVKIILLNNNSLGLVRQQQDLFYEGRVFASRFRLQPDFIGIARGFGIPACDLGVTEDPAGMLAEALKKPGPCLINAPIHADINVYPMVPPGAANREMIGDDNHVLVNA